MDRKQFFSTGILGLFGLGATQAPKVLPKPRKADGTIRNGETLEVQHKAPFKHVSRPSEYITYDELGRIIEHSRFQVIGNVSTRDNS